VHIISNAMKKESREKREKRRESGREREDQVQLASF
jgi:hypothetical protein